MKTLVSIICITYNQAEYLSSCLDSIFSQQVDFQVELIIHDDASTDSTTEIISQYIKKCPFQIKTILQKENQYSKGIDIFSKYIYPKVEGKYIAICEGDDYWTDSRKLSIQIKMLEANQSFSATAHQSTVIYEKENREHLFCLLRKNIIKMDDVMGNRIFHTASFVFRSDIIPLLSIDIIPFAYDRFLFLVCSFYGDIYYFYDNMCVYRKSEIGITSHITYQIHKRDLFVPKKLKEINSNFPYYRYMAYVNKAMLSSVDISLWNYICHSVTFLFYSFSYFPRNIMDIYRWGYLTVWWMTKGRKFRMK